MKKIAGNQKKQLTLRMLTALLCSLLVWSGSSIPVYAWEQPAHEVINARAVDMFSQISHGSEKYRNISINLENTLVDAPMVTTSSKTALHHDQIWMNSSAAQHIIWGGTSADEPHIYVSVKHFYNPRPEIGAAELTDQSNVHGWTHEAVPATEWALSREENPYSLTNAMRNYKRSLELASDGALSDIPVRGDFRDLAGQPQSIEDMRSMYLGKAMRGLGEVMHLVGDMTQPAHVRNDAHPKWEITEQAITAAVANNIVTGPRLDDLSIGSLGDTVFDVMHGMASWTNRNFYSADTIHDAQAEVYPYNGESPYDLPAFSSFSESVIDGYPTWTASFGGRDIPMFRREKAWTYGYNYIITKEFAEKQGEVLLPLAAAGCTRTIDIFLPTLVLQQQIKQIEPEKSLKSLADEQGVLEVRQFDTAISIIHKLENDPQWRNLALQIEYSGPGELWRVRGRKPSKIADLEFIGGKVAAHQDPETGEMVDGSPQLVMALGAPGKVTLSGPVIDYSVEMDDAIFVKASAGIMDIVSDTYVFEQEEPRIHLTTENQQVMPGEKIEFKVEIENPPERYELEWSFGDENPDDLESYTTVRSRSLTMTHIYEQEDDFTVTVRLIDRKRNLERAEDSLDITSVFGDLSGEWDIILTVEEESTVLRNLVIMIMRGLIRFFISPLVEALGEGPVDESVVDSFTFVGSTIECKTNLNRLEEREVAYEGTFDFVGSNTGFFSAPDNIVSVALVMEDGHLIFYVNAIDEYGNVSHYPYLTHGRMSSTSQLDGQFSLPGALSGTWAARR